MFPLNRFKQVLKLAFFRKMWYNVTVFVKGVVNMNIFISDFLIEEKKLHGMVPVVDNTEIAMVQGAFNAIKDNYPDKYHVLVIRECCDAFVQAKKQNISSKMSFMASKANLDLNNFSYETMKKTMPEYHK